MSRYTRDYASRFIRYEGLEHYADVINERRPGFVYGRYGNPTHVALNRLLASLEGAEAGWPARLPAYTPRSIRDPARYRQELLRIRRAGVAFDDMEYLSGVRAVSAPVFRGTFGRDAEAIGALSIVGVGARLSPAALRRLAVPLRDAAQALSAALAAGAAGSPPRPVRKGFRGEGRARG